MQDRAFRAVWFILAIVFALTCLYVGTYYAIVTPVGVIDESPPGFVSYYEPSYSQGGYIAEILFKPMNAIDRKLRPGFWTPSDDPWFLIKNS